MDNSFPREVDPADLYEGPEPDTNISPFPQSSARVTFIEAPSDRRLKPDYVATITAALDILGSRILALICAIAACAMWSWAVYDPQPQRTYAAIAFSLTVFLPAVALYWRRG